MGTPVLLEDLVGQLHGTYCTSCALRCDSGSVLLYIVKVFYCSVHVAHAVPKLCESVDPTFYRTEKGLSAMRLWSSKKGEHPLEVGLLHVPDCATTVH